MASSYPPSELPTFRYTYPPPSTVSDYLRMVGQIRPAPVVAPVEEDDEAEVWDSLGDFA